MTTFRIDTHNKSGEVTLWMQTDCGYRLIIGWDAVEGVKQFADMLLNYYEHRNEKREDSNKVKKVSDSLLRQALGDNEYTSEETG